MYDETAYEEYMRNVLGYQPTYRTENVYEPDNYYIMQPRNNMMMEGSQYEELYPEIYRKINPLVCNECKNVNTQMTNELLEKMTDNIYRSIEVDLKIETKNVRRRRQANGKSK